VTAVFIILISFQLLQIWVTLQPRLMRSLECSDQRLEEKGQAAMRVHRRLYCRQTEWQVTVV